MSNLNVWKEWIKSSRGLCEAFFHYSDDDAKKITQSFVSNRRIDKNIPTSHGSVNLVYAEGLLYNHLLHMNDQKEDDKMPLFVVSCLLGPFSIPVRSFENTYNIIFKRPFKSFMMVVPRREILPSNVTRLCRARRRAIKYNLIPHPVSDLDKCLHLHDMLEFCEMSNDKDFMAAFDDICWERNVSSSGLAADERAFVFWMFRKLGNDMNKLYERFPLGRGLWFFAEFEHGRGKKFQNIDETLSRKMQNERTLFARKFGYQDLKELPLY